MNWSWLVIAFSAVFVGLSGRFEMSSSEAGVFRVDRLTGEVVRCYVPRGEAKVLLVCGKEPVKDNP